MFTGIIERVGRIAALEAGASGGRIRVDAGPLAASLAISSSIAVNGCCLTVVELSGPCFIADLSPETLRRTTFGELQAGAPVNLEQPLSAGSPLGGHFVQGHVDAMGRIAQLAPEGPAGGNGGQNWRLAIRLPAEVERYVAGKGSIAVDGISLTVAAIHDGLAEAAIIPYTYANTNLQNLGPGSAVNIEADVLAKYIERLSEAGRAPAASGLTIERLREEGF